MDEEGSEISSLPSESRPPVPKQGLKRLYSETESHPELIAALATKKQRMNLLKSLKISLFTLETTVRKKQNQNLRKNE